MVEDSVVLGSQLKLIFDALLFLQRTSRSGVCHHVSGVRRTNGIPRLSRLEGTLSPRKTSSSTHQALVRPTSPRRCGKLQKNRSPTLPTIGKLSKNTPCRNEKVEGEKPGSGRRRSSMVSRPRSRISSAPISLSEKVCGPIVERSSRKPLSTGPRLS